MALPTSGFQTYTINYALTAEGTPAVGGGFSVNVPVELITDSGTPQEAATEAVMAAVEVGLQSMADALDAITGISDVKINKSYSGTIAGVDIRD
jgi:hypothetical protein